MLDSIYIGMSGLTGFSKNLSLIGNNVANLNTVGFKTQQMQFADLFYRTSFGDGAVPGGEQQLALGSGLGTAGTQRVFKQGELRATGNDLDAAIDGSGFFVLRKDGEVFYTRAGQFSFDADGLLVTSAGLRVAALVGDALQDINIRGERSNPGKATERVEFIGTLNSNLSSTTPFTVQGVSVFDRGGRAYTGSAVFTNNGVATPGSWLVEVRDDAGARIAGGEIRFNGDGTPAAGFNSVPFTLPDAGSGSSTVNLYFGDPGSAGAARSLSASSSDLRVDRQDGFGVGGLLKATFDVAGQLVLSYSNGQSVRFDKLALATFNDLQSLTQVEGALFRAGVAEEPSYGTAGSGPFGKLVAARVELGNVDLAQEFSDLIVTQRGYQASSQVISTANELIQQLFDLRARR
jgi:flagellar hook protein FlgE